MELLHAYSLDRIKKIAANSVSSTWTRLKGTPFDWYCGYAVGTALNINQTYGIQIRQDAEALGIDLNPYITGSTEPYWITVGYLANVVSVRAAGTASSFAKLSNGPTGGASTIASMTQIFNNLVAQVYVEVAINPVASVYEIYANGILVSNGSAGSYRFLQMLTYSGLSDFTYARDIYIARFDNVERHWLRRWSCETLVPATNNIGAGILLTDGTVATVKETPLSATYPIPAAALGVAVDVSAMSPDLASGIKIDFTDGTKSKSKTSSAFIRTLDTTAGAVGHAVPMGGITPTKDAPTLTVTATAVDRT